MDFKKITLIAVPFFLLAVLIFIGYLFYQRSFLAFPILAKLDFDQVKAAKLLSDPQTLAFTRANNLYLGNLQGEEISLASPLILGEKAANFKISKNRNYINWQSETGILGLDINKRNVFRIYKGAARQSFDVSSVSDKIIFLTKQELLEASLTNGFISQKITLPKLTNPKISFNHVKYSPDGQFVYIRSIHEWIDGSDEDTVVNLKTKQFNFLKNFSFSVGLAPVWSQSSYLLAWRKQGLISYELVSSRISTLIDQENYYSLGPYSLNPQDQSIAFITSLVKERNRPSNSTIFLADQSGNNIAKLLESSDKRLNPDSRGIITDLGWIGSEQLWFTVNDQDIIRNLWIINKDGGGLKKVLEIFDQYSLQSVYMPITNAYTLY